jgi:hypothetical protein
MHQRIVFLAALLGVLAAQAQIAGEEGYIRPVEGDFSQVPEGQEARLRARQSVQIGVDAGETLAFSVRCHRVGHYDNPAEWTLVDAGGTVLQSGVVPMGEETRVSVPDAKPGIYVLTVDAKLNAYSVRSPLRNLTYSAGSSPLKIIYQAPKLFFWVPVGAKEIRAEVRGQGAEQVAFTVRSADGQAVTAGNSREQDGKATVQVPDGRSGQAWSIELSELPGFTFEDVTLILDGDLVPVVAEHPARLLLPMLSAFAKPVPGGAEFGLQINAPPETLAGKRLHFLLREVGEGTVLSEQTLTDFGGRISAVVEREGLIHAEIVGRLLDAEGRAAVTSSAKLAVAHGQCFTEVEHVETHPVAAPSWADQQTGYQVFHRAEPGDIRPNSHPSEEELTNEMTVRVAPGEYETVYFALHPLRDLPGTSVQLGAGTGMTGEVRTVRCWPQLTDWRSTTFHIIPELLELRESTDLRQGRAQQYAVVLQIPDNLAAGVYPVPVEVQTAGQRSQALTLQVEVLPYRLETPPGVVWGLYPDSGRWAKFDEAQIAAELVDFRDHGMNALMLYPMAVAEWTWQDGKMAADFSRFRTYLRLYREAGLGGPMVMSIQSSEGFITRLTGYRRDQNEAEFWGAYRQMLTLIKQESVADQWPEFSLHSVDEPHSGPTLAEAVRTLSVIKEAGFMTFNTCYGKAVREELDPYLDYRCYNNIGFLSMGTPEDTRVLREETLASQDVFWWYGTGCYTNRRLIQDGNTLVNRFMGGVHFWRTGATGCWSWTFLRPKRAPYDDFDGVGMREGKDACIAYHTLDRKALVPTLQWEGLREGVDDYRHLHVLRTLTQRAKDSGLAQTVALGQQAEQRLEEYLATLPWSCLNGEVAAADLDRFRNQVIDLSLELHRALEP